MKLIKKSDNAFDRTRLYKEAFILKKAIETGLMDNKLTEIYKKIGEENEGEYDEKYTKYLSFYMTLQTIYKSFHWLTRGTAFYSDHILFERLHNEVTEEIDFLAEKLISLFGRNCTNPLESTKIVASNLEKIIPSFSPYCDPNDLVAIALYFELLFLEINNQFYSDMQNSGMTMGLDDLIMANHSKHENNLYLLKSRFQVTKLKGVAGE